MTEQQLMPEQKPQVPVWYARWNKVPWSLASKTQLSRADLPREPVGPVRGYVAGRDFRDKETEIALYAVKESRPTKATGGQLAAAEARRSATVRVCTDCGANCQLPLSERRGRYLCPMCWRIATVVDYQIELRERRAENAAWARGLLEGGPLAVVWVEVMEAEPTPSGRKRPPLAARVHAVDENGKKLLNVLVRLAGPRTQGAPADALTPEDGRRKLEKAFKGRRRAVWGPLGDVIARLGELGHPVQLGSAPSQSPITWHSSRRTWDNSVAGRYAQWRGELDPATGALRTPWSPGTADRLWLCLRRMADTVDAGDAGRPGTSHGVRQTPSQGPRGAYAVRVAVTGPAGAGEALAQLLADQEALEPASVVGPVPSREVPDAVVTYMAGRPDVFTPTTAVQEGSDA